MYSMAWPSEGPAVYWAGALQCCYSILIFLLADPRQLTLLLSSLISVMQRGDDQIGLLLELLERLEAPSSVPGNITTIRESPAASDQCPL